MGTSVREHMDVTASSVALWDVEFGRARVIGKSGSVTLSYFIVYYKYVTYIIWSHYVSVILSLSFTLIASKAGHVSKINSSRLLMLSLSFSCVRKIRLLLKCTLCDWVYMFIFYSI